MPLFKLLYRVYFKFTFLDRISNIINKILFTVIFLLNVTASIATEKIVLNIVGKPPLNTANQTGFMDLITREAFKRLGIKLETVQLPAERALINANNAIIDGEMSRIAGLNLKYNNLIQVNEKIMSWEFVVYSKKKIELKNGWQSLNSYSVSIVNGWKILEKNVPAEVELVKVKNPEQLFGMLKSGRSDLIIFEKWGGKYYLKSRKITDIHLINPPLIIKDMFIYLHKKHKKLTEKLALSLKSIKDDGTYERILLHTLKKLE